MAGRPFFAGVRAVMHSKALLLCVSLATAAVSLPFALWMGRAVHAVGSARLDTTEITRNLDPDFFSDVRSSNPSFEADATLLVVASLALAFLVKPLIWGGFTGIAAAQGKRLTFAKFVREGGSTYWQFLRISAVEVVLLVATVLAMKVTMLPPLEDFAKDAARGDVAARWNWIAQGLAFGVLCVVATICDYARVGVRMGRKQRVVVEIGRAALFVIQHPFRTFGWYVVGLVIEVALAAPFIFLMRLADDAYVASSLSVLVLGQLAVAAREASRLFHVVAAWTVRVSEDRPRAGVTLRPGLDGADLLEERLPWHVR